MSNILFSIIIPTRQRHDTLKYSIQSVINQTYNNFEVVVADNFSTPETEEVVKAYADNRIKYHRTSGSLSMEDNWEFGLSKSTGDYIFVLGDDDALMPDALELANQLIDRYKFKIISWLRFFYAWDSSIVPWLRNYLGINLSQIAEIRNSHQFLQKSYRHQLDYEQLPMAYNSFVHRDIIERVISIHGRYFDTHCPDAFSGIVNSYFADSYLYSYRALSITGTSGHSNGAAHLFSHLIDENSKSKLAEFDKNISRTYHSDLLPSLSIKIPVTPETSLADIQLKAKEIFFPNDINFVLDIGIYLKSLSNCINRDPNIYDNLKQYIIALAHRYNVNGISISNKLPIQEQYQAFQGIITDSNGRPNHLRINCAQAGIDNVADAAKLALSVLPHFSQLQVYESPLLRLNNLNVKPKIILDGVFFQLYKTGIARVWKSLLEEWANTDFAQHLVVLDRANTAPKIPGINYYQIPAYDYDNTERDRVMLQQVCDELKADVFISSYYTTPLETPYVFMGYDMIPEIFGCDFNEPMWREKRRAIQQALAYVTISEHTAKDLVKIHPEINPASVTTAHCGVQPIFQIATEEEISTFREQYGITKPYFLLVGCGVPYKNGVLFWQSFAKLENTDEFAVICTGPPGTNQTDKETYAPNVEIHYLQRLDDRELNLAYAGATALVYPSKYEGFGLPIVEAFASGCPVITCPNASIPEVAGNAAIYVNDSDIEGMAKALKEVQISEVRENLITKGFNQVKKFSWTKMAEIVQSVLIQQTLTSLQLQENNLIIFPDWSVDEETLGEELGQVIYQLAQQPDIEGTTLLIDTSNATDLDEANLLLSSVAMNLMMSEDLDITEYLVVSLIGELSPIQRSHLSAKLTGKISLPSENNEAVNQWECDRLPLYELVNIPTLASV